MPDLTQPKQARSRQTLERLAGAAEKLMAEKGFAAMTVDDIVARAGSSKGAFYTRFRSKDALLRYLGTVHFEEALEGWTRFLAPPRWQRRSIDEIVRGLVERLVGIYRRRRKLMRAFVVYGRYRQDPKIAAYGRRLNQHVQDRVEALLAPRLAALGREAPGRAARFGLMAVGSTARDLILFGDPDQATPLADEALVDELTALFLGYLERPLRAHSATESTTDRSPS